MLHSNHILVLGGTGKTGRKIVSQLQQQGHKVRIGSRGATPSFDWDQPENWENVLDTIDTIYITYQPDLAVPGALESIELLIKQAKFSGVRKVVLLSGKGEREAELCEQVVIHSGLAYTIIRASWFFQNFSESFMLEPILNGVVALPQAHVKIPFVDTGDIAEVAVKALTSNEHNGNIYELTGSRTLTFKEAIATIAKTTQRDIKFIPISIQAYCEAMQEQGVPEDFVWLIGYLFTHVLGNPEVSNITNDVHKVLGRPATDFAQYVKQTANTGVWNVQVNA